MTTMTERGTDRYLAAFERLETSRPAGEPGRLRELRRRAADRFRELGFPTTKMEEWRNTNVAPIARTEFELAPPAGSVDASEIEFCHYPGTCRLVVLNGRLEPTLSDLSDLPEGVVVESLAAALDRSPELVEAHLGRFASFDENAFVALNTALFGDGVFVHVPAGVVVEKPINLVFAGRAGTHPVAAFPRNLYVAEENSQVRIVEQYVTLGDGLTYTCPVTEVVTGPSANIDHYKVERESVAAFHTATLQVRQERASSFSSHSLSWGGGIVRNDVNAVLAGEGCDSILNGLYMVEGDQLVDNHMRVEHAAPHCDSHELYKGILEGRARAVFSGRIFVAEGAQKTDAKQTNRNLLLSNEALCNSNPQLEIFADDVKCTHGSTVGRLDDLAVFYLRSRGIGEEAARSLLTYAFASDIVGRIKVAAVRRDLEEFLFRRLPRGEVVRQAV